MGKFNVVRDFDWTSAPVGSSFRKEAPRIWLKSYKINSNQILTAINGFIALGETAAGGADEFYDKLYGESTDPEDDFWFPYLEDSVRSFSNTFGDTFQSGIGGSGGIGANLYDDSRSLIGGLAQGINMANWGDTFGSANSAIKKGSTGDFKGMASDLKSSAKSLVSGSPGTYVETPMFYQYEKNDSPLTFSFILSNAINNGAYIKNLKLIQHLIRINRPLRKSSIAIEPPRIYKVRLHGLRYIRWAVCSDFEVKLLGAKREINKVIVPEAFQVSMTLQSLTLEHAGFMDKVNTPS